MWRYILQRLFLFVPTFIGVTLISFLIMRLAPGDPAELLAGGGLAGGAAVGISTERRGVVDQALAQWRAQFGLDQPLHVQYGLWLKNLFTLNFGDSDAMNRQRNAAPAGKVVRQRGCGEQVPDRMADRH